MRLILKKLISLKKLNFNKNDIIDAFLTKEKDNYEPSFKGIIHENEIKQLYSLLGNTMKKRCNNSTLYYSDVNVTFKEYDADHEYTDEIINDIKMLIESIL